MGVNGAGLVNLLESGGVIAFETDTVWGLGCLPENAAAVKKIYDIKGRDENKPLILMSHDIYPLLRYVAPLPKLAHILIKKYFPGALTVVVPAAETMLPCLPCSRKSTPAAPACGVGIRVPDNETFANLCRQVPGGVLATTSANISGEAPALTYEEACKLPVDLVYPGSKASGVASTVVGVNETGITLLRQGAVVISPLIPAGQ